MINVQELRPMGGSSVSMLPTDPKRWVLGQFRDGLLRPPGRLEVKLWEYPEQPEYPEKTYPGPELIAVYGGVLGIETEDSDGVRSHFELRGTKREWTLLLPNTPKRIVVLEAPAFGVTVRWPIEG